MKETFERAKRKVKQVLHRRLPRRPTIDSIASTPSTENRLSTVAACGAGSENAASAILSIDIAPQSEQASAGSNAIANDVGLAIVSGDTVTSESDELFDDDTSLETYDLDRDDEASKIHTVVGDDSLTATRGLSNSDAEKTSTKEFGQASIHSRAYEEAYRKFDPNKICIFEKENADSLVNKIKQEYDTAMEDKSILKALKKLQKNQGILEVLDSCVTMAKSVSTAHAAASTAVGVVEVVTKFALSLSSVGDELCETQKKVLEELQYVYQCEDLGDGRSGSHVFEVLVKVYRSLLEWYIEAHGIFQKNDFRMAKNLCFEQKSLSEKTESFLENVRSLRECVSAFTATQVKAAAENDLQEKVYKYLRGLPAQKEYHDKLRMVRVDGACDLIIDAENVYRRLVDNREKKLVITGNTGCGKSVAMSFLVDRLRMTTMAHDPKPIICHYYCRHDDSGNSLSVLCGLICAVLNQAPEQRHDFITWYEERKRSRQIEPGRSPRELEHYLRRVAGRLDRLILFAIDGLDECDESSRMPLLALLNDMSEKSDHFRYLVTCLTPDDFYFSLKDGERPDPIDLRPTRDRDTLIIKKEVNENMSNLSDEIKLLVVEKLSAKAEGSALWIRMVVGTIRSSRITRKDAIEAFLNEMPLPEKLSETYQNLFRHCTEGCDSNKDLAWSALKILASTHRDLTLKELAWGAAMANAGESGTELARVKLEADCGRILQLIRPFVTELASPVVEVSTENAPRDVASTVARFTDAEDADAKLADEDTTDTKWDAKSDMKLRLAHQSIKEFVITYGTASGSDMAAHASIPASQYAKFPFLPEKFMMDVCIRYLLLKEIGQNRLFPEYFQDILQLPQQVEDVIKTIVPGVYNPACTITSYEKDTYVYKLDESDFGAFFVYASCYWVEHTARAEPQATPALHDLEELCRHKSRRLENWMLQIRRPNCTWQSRYDLENQDFDPLIVAAFYLPDAVLEQVLRQGHFQGGCYGKEPLVTATKLLLEHRKLPRLQLLLTSHNSQHDRQMLPCFRAILHEWDAEESWLETRDSQRDLFRASQRTEIERKEKQSLEVGRCRDWDALFSVVEKKADVMVAEQWANVLFCLAASRGCIALVEKLIRAAQSNPRLKAAIWGVKSNEAFASLNLGHQSIGLAAASGRLAMVQYLLQHEDANTHLFYVNEHGQTTLHMAARYCEPLVVQALIPRLAGFITRVDEGGQTPMDEARNSRSEPHKQDQTVDCLERALQSANNDAARLLAALEQDFGYAEEIRRARRETTMWTVVKMVACCALALILFHGGYTFILGLLVQWTTRRMRTVGLHMP